MNVPRPRRAMALVAVLAVLALIAMIAVATLSVTGRLEQGSSIAERDASLDAAASYAASTALLDWRRNGFSSLAAGATRQAPVTVPGSPVTTTITVTRLGAELFWIVAQAVAIDDARRQENLVVRLYLPRTDTMPAVTAGGDVKLSRWFTVVADTDPGCLPIGTDLRIAPSASLTSTDGSLPALRLERDLSAGDTSRLWSIGGVQAMTIAASADRVLPGGFTGVVPSGVTHASGDLTLTGGAGQGVLIVDGRLTLSGAVTFVGIIIARGGLVALAAGSDLKGLIRVGPVGSPTSLEVGQPFTLRPSVCSVQTALGAALVPHPVAGRSWAELY